MTRILIADDHDVVRSGLRSIREAHANLEVIAETSNGKEAILKAIEAKPDIAMFDYSLPLVNRLAGVTAWRGSERAAKPAGSSAPSRATIRC
jgi:DNA-binding NarL/FixJ family response regulator